MELLVESLGTSLIVGKIRGGRFSNIASGEIRGWYFIGASFLVEFGAVYLASKSVKIVTDGIFYIHFISYMLLFCGILMNLDKYSFWIITAGVLLNFIVIMANGGRMPVSADALKYAGLYKNLSDIALGRIVTHSLMNTSTKLRFLGDVLPLPKYYPRPKVYSIGDILLAIGVFIYLQQLMLGKVNSK